ncbi:MAG: LPXTG cell wall anchor domain-containing protein [Acidimicrobiales bacterium]
MNAKVMIAAAGATAALGLGLGGGVAAAAETPTQYRPYGDCTAVVTSWKTGEVTVKGVDGCAPQWWVLQAFECDPAGCSDLSKQKPYHKSAWPIREVAGGQTVTFRLPDIDCITAAQQDLVALFGGPGSLAAADDVSEHEGPLGMGGEVDTTPANCLPPPPPAVTPATTPSTTPAPLATPEVLEEAVVEDQVEVLGAVLEAPAATLPVTGADPLPLTAAGAAFLAAGASLLAVSRRRQGALR